MSLACLTRCGALLPALASLSGCADQPPAPFVESDHVRLYHSIEGGACEQQLQASVQFLESAAVAIASYLEMPLPAIEYHWVSESRWPEGTPCAAHATGCTDGEGRVFAQRLVPHELVHALSVLHYGGFRASFLEEGLAEALGGELSDLPIDYPAPPGVLLGLPRIEPVHYGAAGHFVSYLLARHGAAPFSALLADAPAGAPPDRLHAAFARAYGFGPDELGEELATWSLRSLGVGYCGAPTIPWQADALATTQSPSCDWPVGAATVDFEADGPQRIDWRSGPGTSYSLRFCPLSAAAPPFELFTTSSFDAARSTQMAHMRRGRYLLALTGDQAVDGSLELSPHSNGLACDDAVVLAPEHEQLRVSPPPGGSMTVFFRSNRSRAEARISDRRGAVALALCEGCSARNCTRLEDRQPVELFPGVTHALRVSSEAWGDHAGLSF